MLTKKTILLFCTNYFKFPVVFNNDCLFFATPSKTDLKIQNNFEPATSQQVAGDTWFGSD